MDCLVLPFSVADGPANMAADEAMLEAAARGEPAYLRFYCWAAPTLSLGYFQRIDRMRADARWHGVPVVRRPTGGGAIWHDRELTYAIAVPAGFPLGRPNSALYRAVHGAIAAELADRGLAAHRRGETGGPHRSGPDRPFLCFTDRDPDDIVSNGQKVVGSAQRRRDGAVLQHGSILLARSSDVPELPGVSDLARLSDCPNEWEAPFVQRIAAALELPAVRVDWPASLRERSLALEVARYRSADWTEAR